MMLRQQNETLNKDIVAREHQVKLLESQCGERERASEARDRRIGVMEKKVKQLERENQEKSKLIAQKDVEMERLKQKYNEKWRHEQTRIQQIYEREMAEKESRLQREKCINDEKIARCHEILCAESSNWINIGDGNLANMRCTSPPPSNTATGSSGLPAKEGSTPSRTTAHSKSPEKSSKSSNAQSSTKLKTLQRRSEYDILRSEGLYDGENASDLPPVANPRHRRSLSTGNEKWIDHRPTGTLDLGTVFQAKIKNKKSLTNLKNVTVSDLKDASKYALTHHTADIDGNVETEIYKGEIIPSLCSGVQVIFNDVEMLKQGSPPRR